jgi:DNA-binding NtrC family response regulator
MGGDLVVKQRSQTGLCTGNNPVPLNVRCALLREDGWNVLSVGRGHQGVIRFSKEAVDAVVVDRNDGGGEGALIAAELKRWRPEVPVVILTTDEDRLANGATEQANVGVIGHTLKTWKLHDSSSRGNSLRANVCLLAPANRARR